MIITVTPNPAIDLTVEVRSLVRGQVHRTTGRHREPSGKGVNVSRALTSNAVSTTAVFPVGGSDGVELQQLLDDELVRYRTVHVEGTVRVNISVTEPDGTATKINGPGPDLTPHEVGLLLSVAAQAAVGATWVLGSGSLPGAVGDDLYAQLGQVAHGCGARFALDSSGAPFLSGLAIGPDLVKPNAVELAEATGRVITTFADAVSAAGELRASGARTVLVSLGVDGALLVDDHGVLHAGARVDYPRSTVGAGDALVAGYLAGTRSTCSDRARSLREAVAWATASLRLDGSRVPPVTDADRGLVRLTDEANLDVDRRLR